eukprot:5427731-Pleurochrysis_carterae.AAC.8
MAVPSCHTNRIRSTTGHGAIDLRYTWARLMGDMPSWFKHMSQVKFGSEDAPLRQDSRQKRVFTIQGCTPPLQAPGRLFRCDCLARAVGEAVGAFAQADGGADDLLRHDLLDALVWRREVREKLSLEI